MGKLRIELPKIFSFHNTLYSHGWIDLPPFMFDPAIGVLKYYYMDKPEREIEISLKYNSDHSLEVQSAPGDKNIVKKEIFGFMINGFLRLIKYFLKSMEFFHVWCGISAAGSVFPNNFLQLILKRKQIPQKTI